jgi:mono/diheme cytochrome c family protein
MTKILWTKVVIGVLAAGGFSAAAYLAQPVVGATAQQRSSGSAIYAQNCARCHGADGRAQTRKGREIDAVDFTSDDWSPDAARDARIISRGKGSMPAFGRRLSQAQINAVAQYIRRFKR